MHQKNINIFKCVFPNNKKEKDGNWFENIIAITLLLFDINFVAEDKFTLELFIIFPKPPGTKSNS